jgi:hypothetical protein
VKGLPVAQTLSRSTSRVSGKEEREELDRVIEGFHNLIKFDHVLQENK